jgi:hypothetical protein
MKMFKLMAVGLVVGLPGVAMADEVPDVRVALYNSWGNGNGGEFEGHLYTPTGALTPLGGVAATGTYFQSGQGPGLGLFESFCLERQETYTPGTVYTAQIRDYAQADLSGVNNSVYVNGANSYYGADSSGRDALDARTAYLYTNFILHTLSTAYSYGDGVNLGSTAQRMLDAEALQVAIWYIEDEYTSSEWTNLNAGLKARAQLFINEANYAVTHGWSGLGNVRVLNLYHSSVRTDYQSQLIMIPLPPGTGMAGTGLACMAGFGFIQRRRRSRS